MVCLFVMPWLFFLVFSSYLEISLLNRVQFYFLLLLFISSIINLKDGLGKVFQLPKMAEKYCWKLLKRFLNGNAVMRPYQTENWGKTIFLWSKLYIIIPLHQILSGKQFVIVFNQIFDNNMEENMNFEMIMALHANSKSCFYSNLKKGRRLPWVNMD